MSHKIGHAHHLLYLPFAGAAKNPIGAMPLNKSFQKVP
jgi:hypothetical protein